MTQPNTPSAPLTPEEVESKIKEIERRYRITSYSPWKDDVRTLLDIASALQSQLKTRTEALNGIAEMHCDARGGCRCCNDASRAAYKALFHPKP